MSAKKTSSDSSVKPQVIDLDPEDVTVQSDTTAEEPQFTDSPASPTESHQSEHSSPPATSKRSASFALPVAALVAGLLGGGWLYRDVLSTYFPPSEVTELVSRLTAVETSVKANAEKSTALSQQFEQIQAAIQKVNDSAANRQDVSTLQNSTKDTTARLSAVESSIAQTRKQLDEVKSSITSLSIIPGTAGPVDDTALASIRQRLESVEQELVALKNAKPSLEPSAELTQALSSLRQKINEGAAFNTELAALKSLEPDIQLISELEPQASTGLPNAAALAQELIAIAEKLPNKDPAPQNDNGYGSWIAETLSSLITIKTIGEPDWPTLARQAASDAANGNLQQAVTSIGEAQGSKPPEVMVWHDRASARLALEATLTKLSDAVMQRIAEKG